MKFKIITFSIALPLGLIAAALVSSHTTDTWVSKYNKKLRKSQKDFINGYSDNHHP